MKIRTLAISAESLLLGAVNSFAGESLPAWQNPQFVMEEVVVFGQRPAQSNDLSEAAVLAWQTPGYVMEEVVVTASPGQLDVARSGMHRRMVTHRRIMASVFNLVRW